MIIKRTFSDHIADVTIIILLGCLAFLTIYPFYYIIVASVSNPEKLLYYNGILLKPLGFTWGAYKLVFENPMISVGYKNTLLYVGFGTLINMAMTTIGAYALSRKGVFWAKPIMMIIIFTMYFSGAMIPSYLLITKFGWINTIWAMIIPGAVWSWNLIIMRTNFKNVPESFEDSARIDGASDFTILIRIFIPLSLPIMAVITMYYAVGNWNSWFSAAIYLLDRRKHPLQLVLREILIINNADQMMINVKKGERSMLAETLKYSTIMVSTLPILLIYPFLQKYFIKGVMIGGIKE